MNGNDWINIVTALGPVGGLIVTISYVLAKSGFLSKDDSGRADVIDRIDRIDGKLDDKMSKMDDKMNGLRDRMTNMEATMREMSRRFDRIDR